MAAFKSHVQQFDVKSLFFKCIFSFRWMCWKSVKSKIFLGHLYWHGRKMGPSPRTPEPLGPLDSLEPPGTKDPPQGPQESLHPWEITSTIWNSESKHGEMMKLKHKQKTFLNYVIGQLKPKIACNVWRYFIYWDFIYFTKVIRGQSPPLFSSS